MRRAVFTGLVLASGLVPLAHMSADTTASHVKGDFDGDGKSDVIVWTAPSPSPSPMAPADVPEPERHYDGHEPWRVTGMIATPLERADIPSGWHLLATNNFTGSSGGAGLLWRWVGVGHVAVELPSGANPPPPDPPFGTMALTTATPSKLVAPLQGQYLEASGDLPDTWQVVGSGDFNRDGRADLLWWDRASGALQVWPFTGTDFGSPLPLGPNTSQPDLSWHPEAVIDEDADGDADILWQHAVSGALVYWQMEWQAGAVQHTTGAYLTPAALTDSCWKLRAVGDFNGDGYDDLLWHHQSSQRSVMWLLRDGQRSEGNYVTPDRFRPRDADIDACPDPCSDDCPRAWGVLGPR
jgi:hypothetical protein